MRYKRGVGTRTVKRAKQHGRTKVKRDKRLHALSPGKRKTKRKTTYWETRRNRSDSGGRRAKLRTKRAV